MSEANFHEEKVEPFLVSNFGEESVEHEPILEQSDREPDFVVYDQGEIIVVEVEDDFESIFTGVGQALYYASEVRRTPRAGFRTVTPWVIVPEGCLEQPETQLLSDYIEIIEI